METKTVLANCRDRHSGEEYTVPMEAEVYGDVWAVTRMIDPWGRKPTEERGCWMVTHVPTGSSACRGSPMLKAQARRLARRFARELYDPSWHSDDPPLDQRRLASRILDSYDFIAQPEGESDD